MTPDSDTPRTDEFARTNLLVSGDARAIAYADFARELERDLNRWKYRADVLERDLAAARKERDEAHAKVRYYESAICVDTPYVALAGCEEPARAISYVYIASVLADRNRLREALELFNDALVGAKRMIDAAPPTFDGETVAKIHRAFRARAALQTREGER